MGEIRYAVVRGKGFVYVRAIMKGVRIGSASFVPMEYGHEVENVMVVPQHQGKGIATEMIRTGLSHCNVARLCCTPPLIPFYERLGFKVIGECPQQSMVRMECKR